MINEVHTSRYSNLEKRLESDDSSSNHHTPKLAVIMDRQPNAMLRDKSHIEIAQVLRLEGKPREELETLDFNVLGPIGNKLNLLNAVSSSKSVDRDTFRKGFMDFFTELMDKEELNGKQMIKEVIIYPLIASSLGDISTNDYRFSVDIAESIKSADDNPASGDRFMALCGEKGIYSLLREQK